LFPSSTPRAASAPATTTMITTWRSRWLTASGAPPTSSPTGGRRHPATSTRRWSSRPATAAAAPTA
jgi:hypothetical protein